jgi:hypothetical protein
MKQVIEAEYPIGFRKAEAEELGAHLSHHHSVVLVGMKRVGISNFLRFFLNHDGVVDTYIHNGMTPLFVQCDLNDLIEINISAFWTLLLTRVVDSAQNSNVPESVKRQCRKLFVQSIQLKDHFFTVDSLRKTLDILVTAGYYPTLFIIRFDRLQSVVTPEFLSNLLGLRDAVKQKLSYVFTSYRPLADLAPLVFNKQSLSVFAHYMYLAPAKSEDMRIILQTLLAQYHTTFNETMCKALLDLSGGYVQYLQLAIIRLREEKKLPKTSDELYTLLSHDEQITFQSEELFESLTKGEKEVVLQVKQGNKPEISDRDKAAYLWNTGIVRDEGGKAVFFSPLFDEYVGTLSMSSTTGKEFTKKEHFLFTYLKDHEGVLCERDAIIEAVWPEHKDMGVSDWAIDRLVARLRSKLKSHGSPYSIVTVVTRGYKLVTS